MNKKELMNFIEPFSDDIEIKIGGTKLMAPHKYTLEYRSPGLVSDGCVLINVEAAAVVVTCTS